jgi:uncharacterized membrane protein
MMPRSESTGSASASCLKFLIGWAMCFGIRFVTSAFPAQLSNIDPIMATTMPFARRFGFIAGFIFASLSIFLFDAVTSGIGIWTWVTAATYGFIGVAASLVLGKLKGTWWQYGIFALIATIVYDVVTGVLLGPALFGGSMREAFMGQIPFTIKHLAGNVILSVILSPLIDRWVIRDSLEVARLRLKTTPGHPAP